jgi:hypothetical protein
VIGDYDLSSPSTARQLKLDSAGSRQATFDPLDLGVRLAAMVPPPRQGLLL